MTQHHSQSPQAEAAPHSGDRGKPYERVGWIERHGRAGLQANPTQRAQLILYPIY
jgi:hypothetical protein